MEKIGTKILSSKGTIGKICVTFLVIYLSTLSFFIYFMNQDNSSGFFKTCVNEKYDEAITYFDESFTIELGKVLEHVPDEHLPTLNEKFMKFKNKFRAINGCLIREH